MSTHAIDRPYDRLQPLPRGLWLPSLVNSSGERGQRLGDVAVWLQALTAGRAALQGEHARRLFEL